MRLTDYCHFPAVSLSLLDCCPLQVLHFLCNPIHHTLHIYINIALSFQLNRATVRASVRRGFVEKEQSAGQLTSYAFISAVGSNEMSACHICLFNVTIYLHFPRVILFAESV